MAVRTQNILSICTGGGGLDLGVRLACPGARTVCHVEREAFAVANLVAAIQASLMDEAPIWSDLQTFDGEPWRGTVDWLIGGIPCQPRSTAGQRRGAEDDRDLWPVTARIIGEVGPDVVFLENVAGILRYFHERIGPDLQAMGYRTEEGLFSAAEVGAPHVRQRLFVLALTSSYRFGGRDQGVDRDEPDQVRTAGSVSALAYAERGAAERRGHEVGGTPGGGEGEARHQRLRADAGDGDECVAHADDGTGSAEPELQHQRRCLQEHDRGESFAVADGAGDRRNEGSTSVRCGQFVSSARNSDLGHAHSARLQGCQCGQCTDERSAGPSGSPFPPAPTDLDAWARVLAEVPALEPAFCRVADGMAATGDRSHRLGLLGNGVVPLVGAHALRTLAARAGLT